MAPSPVPLLRIADQAQGGPYHAALVGRSARAAAPEIHGHADYFEFVGVLRGTGVQLLSHGVQRLRAGDVVLVGPGDRHALRGTGTEGMLYVNLAFPAAAWRGFIELADLPEPYRWEGGALPPCWHLTGRPARRAERVFRKYLGRYERGASALDLVGFWTELAELTAPYAEEAAAGLRPAEVRRPEWLTRACAAMRTEEALRDGVPRLRRLAAVSPAHLSRSMREHYGTTPTEYVRVLRLEHAARLLCATRQPVTAIAQRCGFASHTYLSRCFAAAYGLPPREYRRRAWGAGRRAAAERSAERRLTGANPDVPDTGVS
ncbi:helix-turn-helix transcriptional regulator [Phaeacidiphilus oryzae]|uniref:helix-turn-helix transcriptional regulator n=1 Tax=Phaeacidiphilus oryzae TaxID=348818 RepID=UPI00068B311D|nr:AraC family transcriptional regulator [Phaeacidiphilus oryzae]